MANTIFSKRVTAFPGLRVKTKSKYADAVIILDDVNTAPTTSGTDYGALYMDGGNLYFAYNGTATALGGSGGGGTPSFETLVAADQNMALSTSTWTISQSGDLANLTLVKTGTGAGAIIDITNGGTGADIIGHGDTWQISKTGVITATGLTMVDSQVITLGTGSDATIQWDTAKLAITGVTDFASNVTMAASASLTMTGVAGSNMLVLTAGDISFADGSLILADNDDDAVSFQVTNNTADSTGSASSLGVVNFVSTSMVDGCLLNLELTEGTLSGGYYLRCWDATGAGSNLSVGENGVIVMSGTATSNSLTITAGDIAMADGSITVADADNAASLSVTNNTATTASPFVLTGSGTFTGNTTSAFFLLSPTGLTTGTAVHIPLTAMTTGKGFDINAAAQTDGIIVDILGGGASATSTSRLLKLDYGAAVEGEAIEIATTGVYVGAGLITITADAATTCGVSAGEGIVAISADGLTTGVGLRIESLSNELFTSGALIRLNHTASGTTVAAITGALLDLQSSVTELGTSAQNYDVASFKRTSIHTTAGTLTASGSVLKLENVATETTATLADTVIGLEIVMDADGTGAGIQITHSAVAAAAIDIVGAATTTGKGVDLSDLNALTTGIGVHLASSATAITTTGRLLYSNHSGNASTDGILNEFASAAADETTILKVTASAALALGAALEVSVVGMTTGTAIEVSNLTALTTGKGLHLDATADTQTSGILCHIDSASDSITGAGRLLRVDHTGTTGTGAVLAEIASAATDDPTVFRVTASGALAAGVLLDVSGAAVTTGTLIDCGNADALTTGSIANLVSNSADATARTLVTIHNNHSSAVGVLPLQITQDGPVNTNFAKCVDLNGVTLFTSDGTTPNGNLSGAAGDVCFGADSGKSYYCTGTTNWTAF